MNGHPIRLILIDDAEVSANAIASAMQPSGHPVDVRRITSAGELEETFASGACDLVVARPQADGLSAAEVLDMVLRSGGDIPLLVLSDGTDSGELDRLLVAGASDVIDLADTVRCRHRLMAGLQAAQDRRRLRHCRQRLEAAERRAAELAVNSRDAVAFVADGSYEAPNQAFLELFGFPGGTESPMPVRQLTEADDGDRLAGWIEETASGEEPPHPLTFVGVRSDGSQFHAVAEAAAASQGGRAGAQVIVRPLTGSEGSEPEERDLLTGLFNRDHFIRRLQDHVTLPKTAGHVLLIRPDNLREVTRAVGVAGSDLAFSDFTTELSKRFSGHLVARVGAESVAVLLPKPRQQEAEQAAGDCVAMARDHGSDIAGVQVSLTCSIGIAGVGSGESAEEVLANAEAGAREAMRRGGNTFALFDPEIARKAEQERLALWEAQIRAALEQERFRLLFQPIVSLRGDPTENYEALLRLVDEAGQYIPPSDFLPAARRSGLMTAIDRWVIRHATHLLGRRGNINLFVKLSEESLDDETFCPWIDELVAHNALPAMALTLEVNGEAAARRADRLGHLLDCVHRNGMRMAIDHFRPQPAWETLLGSLAVDFLKFDGSLVNDIASSQAHQQQVRSVVQQAKVQGTATIAQFVENANTLAVLWTCGIDYIQGYFLREPEAELNFDFNLEG